MGIVIPLLSMREFTFSGTHEVVLEKALQVPRWTSGTILLRCHENGITDENTIELVVRASAPSLDDPSQDFVFATELASPGFDRNTVAPDLKIASLGADFGGHLQVVVAGTFGSGTCRATISADLSLKA
jgi:hypothetical protein